MSDQVPGRIPFAMGEIDPGAEAQAGRGWVVEINDQPVTGPVTSARFVNERMGVEIRYGRRPEGFDGPIVHEPGGGGAVTIPYLINPQDGRIYIGLVEEYRAAAGGVVRNVPRGFLDPGEAHIDGAVRETAEETGLQVLADHLIYLGGGINPNSTFFDTSRVADDGQPEGASIYGLPVAMHEVEEFVTADGSTAYRFHQDIRDRAVGDKIGERIVGSVFVPMDIAVASPDIYTSAAAGRLAAYLMGSGALRLSGIGDTR